MDAKKNRIRALRDRLGMKQREFAVALGVKASHTISRWENARHAPQGVWVGKLAGLFHVTEEEMRAHLEAGTPLPEDDLLVAATEAEELYAVLAAKDRLILRLMNRVIETDGLEKMAGMCADLPAYSDPQAEALREAIRGARARVRQRERKAN